MGMIEVKTSELIGPALDWAVAKSEHLNARLRNGVILTLQKGFDYMPYGQGEAGGLVEGVEYRAFSPSSSWAQCGPLIEKNRIELRPSVTENWLAEKIMIRIETSANYWHGLGPTILIAACRAIAQGNLGDTVSVPRELMQ